MNMAKKLHIYILLLTCLTSLLSCNGDEDGMREKEIETITLLIAAPQNMNTKAVGDPGEAVQEGKDWDKLAIIFSYTEYGNSSSGSLPVDKKFLTKEEFENLPTYMNTPYRLLRLNIPSGKVHIYGVTYSSTAASNPEEAIQNCGTDAEVMSLTISNDYATGDENKTEKFLSVATGYYQDENGKLAEFDVSNRNPILGEIAPAIPSMKLIRLASKIDIQWDAQDAYTPTSGYTDVKVEGFQFHGHENGYLFPNLATAGTQTEKTSSFHNTSEISKRNGRVYHYVFPDKTAPKITFDLSANGATGQTYTFTFPYSLQPATWYKINTTIRGMTGNTTITL